MAREFLSRSTHLGSISAKAQIYCVNNLLIEDGDNGGGIRLSSGGITLEGKSKLTIDTSATPASPTATGVAGTICWDTGYLYICTATNVWTKVPLYTDGVPKMVLGTTFAGAVIAGSTTSYGSLSGSITTFSATESLREWVVPVPGTLKTFYLKTIGAQPPGGALVCTVRKNGANTGITVTIPASNAAATFSDLTNTVTVAAGDVIDLKGVNASTSAAAALGSCGLVLL